MTADGREYCVLSKTRSGFRLTRCGEFRCQKGFDGRAGREFSPSAAVYERTRVELEFYMCALTFNKRAREFYMSAQ